MRLGGSNAFKFARLGGLVSFLSHFECSRTRERYDPREHQHVSRYLS